jgi:hypothetical protein
MATRRKTIGNNPLDAVIPDPKATINAKSHLQPQPLVTEIEKVAKERLTIHLSVGLIEKVKNAVYWTPGLTLAALAETALQQLVDELEKQRGEPFPPRKENLKGGRPLK